MRYDENDIDFSTLDPSVFEELCFDLLIRLGFQELQWRRAGADSGRDIEGKWLVQLPIIGASQETWAIECKHYSRGVPPDALSSKFSWADAERPDRLLIFVSSHLTNGARDWLSKRKKQVSYRVHVVEGKTLRQQLIAYDELVERYFGGRYARLLSQAFESWALHGLIPSLETLGILLNHIDPTKLTIDEVAFLWCVRLFRKDEIHSWEEGEEKTFPGSVLLDQLSASTNMCASVIDPYHSVIFHGTSISSTGRLTEDESKQDHSYFAEILVDRGQGPRIALYAYHASGTGSGCEVLVVAGARPEASVRYLQTNAYVAFRQTEALMLERYSARSRRTDVRET